MDDKYEQEFSFQLQRKFLTDPTANPRRPDVDVNLATITVFDHSKCQLSQTSTPNSKMASTKAFWEF